MLQHLKKLRTTIKNNFKDPAEDIHPYLRNYYTAFMETENANADLVGKEKVQFAHEKGFFYNSAVLYNLNESNYLEYLSDYEYFKLFPMNGNYAFWINDKLTLMYTLREYKEYLPKYYFHIGEEHKVYSLLDYKHTELYKSSQDKDSLHSETILKLLESEKALIAKPVVGAVSSGLHVLKCQNGVYYDNKNEITKDNLLALLDSLNEYIVEEFIDFVGQMPENSDCIRLVVLNKDGYNPEVVCAYLIMDNIGAATDDTIYFPSYVVSINLETGLFEDTRYINFYANISSLKKAPLVNRVFEDTIPEHQIVGSIPLWKEIKEKTEEICKSIPQLSYLGLDVIITKDSFKILEINSHQDPVCQIYTPFLKKGTPSEVFFKEALNRQ